MQVAELIQLLELQDPEAEVFFAYDYGDHVHSIVAETPTEIGVENVAHSDYHRQEMVIDSQYEDDYREDNLRQAVVIRGDK